ncbi:SET domain-containing protein [Rhynchospora pubera]|uniref:SET domain-containing protein n=1 Tax=Rhynchospora pubera TaxID=906938 RepID=A0AAV8DX34_9POAL|nr:SET domain-containing protein [Rhynchospora pubera]
MGIVLRGAIPLRTHLRPLYLSSRLRCTLASFPSPTSTQSKEVCNSKENDDFLQWLRQKSGTEISSVLSVGSSVFGRSLFASKPIEAGDCILKIPFSAHISVDNLPLEMMPLIPNEIDSQSLVAVALLAEQNLGQKSDWAPYVNCLPGLGEMHNSIFWSKEELEMIRPSFVYSETIEWRKQFEKDFLALKTAMENFPDLFGNVQLENFLHARALVSSRAWEIIKGVAMIPFADFLNHDGSSNSVLAINVKEQRDEVIADRSYAVGDEVFIRYGKFSNATLLLDFGFTLPVNCYDQVRILMDVTSDDPLYAQKCQLLHEHSLPTKLNSNTLKKKQRSFLIKQVRTFKGKVKGIPLALRAFARVLSATSVIELEEMAKEAAQSDGRLARSPLKNRQREMQAHLILFQHLDRMIQGHLAALKGLQNMNVPDSSEAFSTRRKMAKDLLGGELRVLHSAHSWLAAYCKDMSSM